MIAKRSNALLDWEGHSGEPTENEQRATTDAPIKIEVSDLNVLYGKVHALHDVNVAIPASTVTAFVGPSGSGKSTFLRALNRLHDLTPGGHATGTILLDGEDISLFKKGGEQMARLRQQVGMLFQHPHLFPMSIFENVAFGIRLQRNARQKELREIVEQALRHAALWDEVKDQLQQSALQLAAGQQQRLCLARVLAVSPEVILMDDPCGTLDPYMARTMENLIIQLGQQRTIVIATTNSNIAKRVAHMTGHFIDGYLVQYAPTPQAFSQMEKEALRML